MATPHISAESGQIAPLVIMPGDPRRAEKIATKWLDDAVCVSQVRGMGIFTGSYHGTPVSVAPSGMGIPSLMIYANELFSQYGVQRIIRVGTAGGIAPQVRVRDVLIGAFAHTDSRIADLLVPDVRCSLAADYRMLSAAVTRAHELLPIADGSPERDDERDQPQAHIGGLYSSDFFYLDRPDITDGLESLGTLGVEMEAAGLYATALQHHRQALAVCTVSDHLRHHENDLSADERETRFSDAVQIALAGLLA